MATNLFIKRAHGQSIESVTTFDFSPQGIAGNIGCSPLRQVLITSQPVSDGFGVQPSELRENITVSFPRLYDLPSGTVVKIGTALIRLTFHCEPCKKVLHLADFDTLVHKRGYLGSFLNSGSISVGDNFSVTDQKYEAIPYAVKDRVRWLLGKGNAPTATSDLLHSLGLPSAYARALPRMIESIGLANLLFTVIKPD
jgi:MOSC domain-containing protein YiiM